MLSCCFHATYIVWQLSCFKAVRQLMSSYDWLRVYLLFHHILWSIFHLNQFPICESICVFSETLWWPDLLNNYTVKCWQCDSFLFPTKSVVTIWDPLVDTKAWSSNVLQLQHSKHFVRVMENVVLDKNKDSYMTTYCQGTIIFSRRMKNKMLALRFCDPGTSCKCHTNHVIILCVISRSHHMFTTWLISWAGGLPGQWLQFKIMF